jgi:hypothetical protein
MHIFRLSDEGVRAGAGSMSRVSGTLPARLRSACLLLKSHHDLPHERSGLARWRNRLGDWFEAVLAESLRIAHDSGAQKARRLWGGSR